MVARKSEPSLNEAEENISIDTLVQEMREKSRDSIVEQCGTMQVLDMTQAIGLNEIYISVNILETISGRRRLEIADLLQGCTPENFNRCGLGRIAEERVPGLQAVKNHSKLIVLGRPGSGKTTFLKYLAIACSLGEFQSDKLAIFLTLKDFAEAENQPSLSIYISQLLMQFDANHNQTNHLLLEGRIIILLDGLDEVKEEDSRRIINQIRDFSNHFSKNQIVITCRIAGRVYTFKQFVEVEIADFDEKQIASFATKWFAATDARRGKKFIQKLQENKPIQELANNPLLLTLLCLVFEDSVDFPVSISELYKLGTNLLLKRWDADKNIERSHVYKKLSVQQKKDLLSQIALLTFEQGSYFFSQEELVRIVADYIQHLHESTADVAGLQINSTGVIKAIEAQHGLLVERARGIYSFSHLTFQEYFAAREIVSSCHPQLLATSLQRLVSRITERRWREVFLLTVGMLRNANYTLQLMKQQIDNLLAQHSYLQALLAWANQKSCTVNTPYKRVVVRAFYLALARTLVLVSSKLDLDSVLTRAGDTLEIAFTLDPTFTLSRTSGLELSFDRALVLALARALALAGVSNADVGLARALAVVLERLEQSPFQEIVQQSSLQKVLPQLRKQLPDPNENEAEFQRWWQTHGDAWAEQLRAIMIQERNIGHNWQFSSQQRQVLRQYYDASQLLLDCLHSNCYVNRSVREEVEETLLLPIADIENRT